MDIYNRLKNINLFKDSPKVSPPQVPLLHSVNINTKYGLKEICVYCGSITDFTEDIDILTTSAYIHSYVPTRFTVFEALYNHDISVQELAQSPYLDLRSLAHIWLSNQISNSKLKIHRIGCIEFDHFNLENSVLQAISAYFHMLDISSIHGVKIDTIALPLLGSGSQGISAELIIVPLLNECLDFLKRNPHVKRICFIEKNSEKANLICDYMKQSYTLLNESQFSDFSEKQTTHNQSLAFISYASPDKNIADNLCSKLEARGIKVWYAPRDVIGPYAEAIHKAINACTHFIVILSQNSVQSQHVLNEIDLAFKKLPNHVKFKPLRIDHSMFTPSFEYYLARQHWMDAIIPPLEDRLIEFVHKLEEDI